MMLTYFGRKQLLPDPIVMNNHVIERVFEFKPLGIYFNNKLTWDDHINFICQKASKCLYFVILLRCAGYSPLDITEVFTSVIRSVLEYGCVVWHPGITKYQARCIEHIQKRALDIAFPELEYLDAIHAAGFDSLESRRVQFCQTFFENIQKPHHKLHHLLLKYHQNESNLRTLRPREPFKCRTKRFQNSPINYLLYKFQ